MHFGLYDMTATVSCCEGSVVETHIIIEPQDFKSGRGERQKRVIEIKNGRSEGRERRKLKTGMQRRLSRRKTERDRLQGEIQPRANTWASKPYSPFVPTHGYKGRRLEARLWTEGWRARQGRAGQRYGRQAATEQRQNTSGPRNDSI